MPLLLLLVEVHRTGKLPSGRTGLTEAGYLPDRTLSLIVNNEVLFSELGNEDYEKRSRLFPQSGEKLFSPAIISWILIHSQQIHFFDAHTLFLS